MLGRFRMMTPTCSGGLFTTTALGREVNNLSTCRWCMHGLGRRMGTSPMCTVLTAAASAQTHSRYLRITPLLSISAFRIRRNLLWNLQDWDTQGFGPSGQRRTRWYRHFVPLRTTQSAQGGVMVLRFLGRGSLQAACQNPIQALGVCLERDELSGDPGGGGVSAKHVDAPS